MPLLRVVTYTMHAGRAAAANTIREARPDVACVHNAPHRLRWRSKCAALARTSGLVVVGGGRPAGANLIMSTLSVEVDAVHDVDDAVIAVLRFRGARFAVVAAPASAGELQDVIERVVPAGTPVVVGARPGLVEVELPD
jgi:hypothetical protein